VALGLVWAGWPIPTAAHRLDEYLQAARIGVALDRVAVELDLTPGIAVAPSILPAIDRDGNGDITESEGEAYARAVVEGLAIDVDGRRVRARLEAQALPAWRDVAEGTGMIRLQAVASIPRLRTGRHEVRFRNVHRSDIGVYLVNALVPADDRVTITRQRRDFRQHELTIDVRVGRAGPWPRAWAALATLLVAVGIGVALTGIRRAERAPAR
jgi:hypothetical protein